MQTHGAFIILGDPGAGKTTTQQRIAYDAARNLLEGQPAQVPLFVRLSQQGEREPYAFLETEWRRRTGTEFQAALNAGRVLILADGINEIPREKRNERLKAWMIFEQEYRGVNRLIFSGRERDYDNQLNLPRVIVQPLDPPRIAEFLKRHQAKGLEEFLADPQSRLGEMAANPLNLFVLTMVYLQGGKNLQLLANRGRLFEAFSDWLLRNEQRWHPDDLSVDCKVDLLARLAYAMQQQGSGATFDLAAAKSALPASVEVMGEDLPLDPTAFLRFGRGASILDPATLPEVRFYHHLLQEYFAARELLRRFNSGENLTAFWQAPRAVDEMPPTDVGEWDPLPEPPVTGWEVTTILACGLSRAPEKLIEAVRQVNPNLAGRCLDEAGLPPLLPGEGQGVRAAVQADLLADLYNPHIHLRARLQAGLTLGRIGDPRFAPTLLPPSPTGRGAALSLSKGDGGEGVKVILPKMVNVPGGKYIIGSNPGEPGTYQHEYPQHEVEIAPFSIGKWPVTNAEFACFMAADGYENDVYWEGELAKRWLKGEDVTDGQFKTVLASWKALRDNPGWQQRVKDIWSPEQIEAAESLVNMTEGEVREMISKEFSRKSRSQPDYWNDTQYNNPSQPVVGITWFEARAYCAWLSAMTGKPYRLPTEVEWEAAARGLPPSPFRRWAGGEVRIYPWGNDWDPAKANSLEGRVLKPSPVGAYTAAGGRGPFEAEDQAGNVWNWTSSLYLPYPYDPPHSEILEAEGERVARGGSWGSSRDSLRCACCYWIAPGGFSIEIGVRLVSPGL